DHTKIKKELSPDDFETNMENSIFNQLDLQQAYECGSIFFNEYLEFHNIDQEKTTEKIEVKKEKFVFPEIDFEEFN
ncbi:MAG TPA: hypothetical protein VFM72_01935, partial [Aequorivita sp.]|nr:hypothetical protein [Aequorivita sp.]